MGWIGPVIGAAGSLIAGGLNYLGGKQQNVATQDEAQKNRDWQERMSSTAYQRAMADMEKAGLNPILAVRGSGASTPSGSAPQMQNELAGAVNSALEAQRAFADIKYMRAQTKSAEAEAAIKEQDKEIYKSAPWLRWIEKIGPQVSSAVGAAKGIAGAFRGGK